jgi:hypothetical protein
LVNPYNKNVISSSRRKGACDTTTAQGYSLRLAFFYIQKVISQSSELAMVSQEWKIIEEQKGGKKLNLLCKFEWRVDKNHFYFLKNGATIHSPPFAIGLHDYRVYLLRSDADAQPFYFSRTPNELHFSVQAVDCTETNQLAVKWTLSVRNYTDVNGSKIGINSY